MNIHMNTYRETERAGTRDRQKEQWYTCVCVQMGIHASFLTLLDIDQNDAKSIAEWKDKTVAQAIQLLVDVGLSRA